MVTCASCHTEVELDQAVTLQGKQEPKTVCRGCHTELVNTLEQETHDPNLAGAILVGLGAAAASAGLWYSFVTLTQSQFGLIAVAVGWLVAQGVLLGSGRKRGTPVQVISLVLTALALMLSEYFITRHYAVAFLAKAGVTDLPLFLPVTDMVAVVADSVTETPMTLLFWAIALWEAFKIPARRSLSLAPTPVPAPAQSDEAQ